MPAFENLLPSPFNRIILDLLFELATWHGLAKLRLHTDTTLELLRGSTKRLGRDLRLFEMKVCPHFDTRDFPTEEAARIRRKANQAVQAIQQNANNAGSSALRGPKRRKFNINTYKVHALGDYEAAIREFGTSDNYNTQTGELEHCRVKRFYPRTSKAKFTCGISRQERQERVLHYMDDRLNRANNDGSNSTENNGNSRLRDHLLGCIRGLQYNGDEFSFTDQDRNEIIILNNMLYHADFMVISDEDEEELKTHPYCIMRVYQLPHFNNLIDNPSNGFSLVYDAHTGFDRFSWCLTETEVENQYTVTIFDPDAHRIRGLVAGEIRTVVFRAHSDNFKEERTRKRQRSLPPRSSFHLYPPFHAAITGVLHTSGAGKFLDELFEKFPDDESSPAVLSWDVFERQVDVANGAEGLWALLVH
ncbi:hypothetical protein AX17_002418 [Amanita inopinata Kibby_2008]|nr:hypothetical protein AX17_002418 [Amanita inopinata Kibby_2008]